MKSRDAVSLLIEWFPVLKKRVDHPDDLFEMPHVSFGLLATEILANCNDEVFVKKAAKFVDQLANSGDQLLEELLVIDVFEGIAQDPDLTLKLRAKLTPRAKSFLDAVESEYFGRGALHRESPQVIDEDQQRHDD